MDYEKRIYQHFPRINTEFFEKYV